jgi:hypothetical protein
VRSLSKVVCLAVGLFAIGLASSSVRANDLLAGSFKLQHPTQWNNTTLPAGDYTFRLARTQNDSDMLMIRGEKQSLSVFVYSDSACKTCQDSSLNLAVRGGTRYVTSLELAGFHVNFKMRQSAGAKEEEMAKGQQQSEQVAVHVDGSN